MQESPFSTPLAELGEEAEASVPALWQPYLVVAAMFLVGMGAMLLDTLRRWSEGAPIMRLLSDAPDLLGPWLSSLVASAAVVVLFMQAQRERHRIRKFMPLVTLAVVFAVLQALAMELYRAFLLGKIQGIARLLNELSDFSMFVIPAVLIVGTLAHLLLCLVPLWILLAAIRSRCARQHLTEPLPIPRVHVALGVALGFSALAAKPLSGVVRVFLLNKVGQWALAVEMLSWLVPATVVLACVYLKLPPWLPRYSTGRILLAAVSTFFGWVCITAMFGLLGYVFFHEAVMRLKASSGLPLVASIAILGPLLLLVHWACIGALWLTRRTMSEPLPAQSSPR